ncbi:MAG: macB 2 [Verrucomicrobia bacterium]|nr:macB 2 [Verrucomicrobiota bacterium]
MNLFHRLAHYLGKLTRRRRAEAEMAEEMKFHLEQRAADYAGDGLSAAEARQAARRRFGNAGALQEQARDAWGWGWLERLGKDVHLAIRQLARSPGFTFLSVLTLGLGIGANTATFSIVNAIMFKPLPYPDSGQLDRIDRVTSQNPQARFSPADWLELQRNADRYGELAAYWVVDTSLADPGQPAEFARASRISPNFFAMLRVPLAQGRDFRAGEDVPGRDRVVIISRLCWLNRFGGRADIVGHRVRIDGESHEIIGVLPASFNDGRHLGPLELFRPLAFDHAKAADRRSTSLRVLGRRAPNISPTEASAFIATLGAGLAQEFPEVNAGSTWRTVPLNRTVIDENGRVMMSMLIALSGFVLLIACSNLANLLLARTITRAREFALRSALGASRLQLLRPLITESLVLALAGGACAMLLAWWAMDYLTQRTTDDNGAKMLISLDGRVLAWAFAASLVTAMTFGLAPALFALRLNVNNTLKSGARGATGGRGHQRFRQILIVGQFALALVLLAGAALFVRGLDELNSRRAGWDSEHLITGSVVLPTAAYPDADRINGFHRLALERLQSLPGVASASVSTYTPFFQWFDVRKYVIQNRTAPPRGREPAAVVNRVSAEYFATVGTRIVSGRSFNERDTATSTKVFIVSQTTATAWFGKENPIGHRLARSGTDELAWGEIIGVAADVKAAVDDSNVVKSQLYQPMAQEANPRVEIAVRTAGVAPAAVLESVRAALTALDPDLPVRSLQTAGASIVRANYQLAVLRDLLGTFALLGLSLASLGIYGVITRTMAQRSGEFAIRVALGACVRDITRLVLTSGAKLALVGSTVGLVGAIGISQLIIAAFPTMRFNSAPTIVGATLLLIAIALLACWLPARRAGKVDAMQALRAE